MDQPIIIPNGSPASDEESNETERKRERFVEDEHYVPVIIKRNDKTRRHPDDTLETAIHEGLEQLNRSTTSLALSVITSSASRPSR